MDWMTDILRKADYQHIREFLLYGVECAQREPGPYEKRIKQADYRVYDLLKEVSHDSEQYEFLWEQISLSLSQYANVYMEMGLRAGIRLAVRMEAGD